MLGRIPGASKLGSFVKGKGGLLGLAANVAGGIGGLLGKAGGFLGGQTSDDTYEDQGPIFGESAFANNLNQNVRQIGSLGQGKRGVIAFNDKSGRGDRDNGMMDQLQIRENQQKEQKMQVAQRAEAARKEAQQNAFRYKTENVIDKMAKSVGNLLSNIGSGSSSMLSTLGNVLAIALKEFRFFISVLVPNVSLPTSRTERLTSARIDPSWSLQSDTPRYCIIQRSFSR
jgi:hypothetical protein